MKFNSPDFFLPFAQSVNRPLCHVNGKKPLFLVSLVNEVTLTGPAQLLRRAFLASAAQR